MSRNSLPPGMKISFWVGRSAPPDSTSATVGSRFSSAIWEARKIFLTVHGFERAALHRRVVGGDHALDALDHADAGDHAGADGEVGAPAGQRGQLEERDARVDQQLDPLARHQLAAVVVPVDVLLAAAGHRLGVLGVEVGELLEHRLAIGCVGSDGRSVMACTPAVVADRSVSTSVAPPPMPQDPGVAVVPLHLGPVHVAGAAVQLHGLVDDVRRTPRPRSAWPGRPRRSRSRPATCRAATSRV